MGLLLANTQRYFDSRRAQIGRTFERGRVRTSRAARVGKPRFRRLAQNRLRQLQAIRYDQKALIHVATRTPEVQLRLLAGVVPVMARAYERHIIPVADWAARAWPVDTGLSASLLRLDFEAAEDTVSSVHSQGADYGHLIRFKKKPGEKRGPHVWTTLVVKPSERAAVRMADDIGQGLVDVT